MSAKDLAGQLTDHDWNLFNSIHQVQGAEPRGKAPTAGALRLVWAHLSCHPSPGGADPLCAGPPAPAGRHHRQPGALHAPLQRAPVLGGHGAVSLPCAGPAGPAAPEVHQAGCPVSVCGLGGGGRVLRRPSLASLVRMSPSPPCPCSPGSPRVGLPTPSSASPHRASAGQADPGPQAGRLLCG